MKIEILEKIQHGRDVFEPGDIRTVPDTLGAYFCNCGWAKDVDGKTPTGTRDVNRVVTLDVDGTAHEHNSEV